ncbi:hypothetical protein [Chromobacterium vaccinii]|uniref:hypothetical protein n=1 Tax=Chromobacterium vaccinii TaxID=1108595 RepID=UPI003459136B
MATVWEKKDEYYLQGPGSWTICKIHQSDKVSYELWDGSPRDGGSIRARTDTAEQAKTKFEALQAATPAA